MTSMEVSEFEALRQHLMSVAYRLTGTVADAEDIVQEAWLRWDSQDTVIADPRAWLTTVVSRLGLDKLRSAPACPETPVLGKDGVMSGGSSRRYPPELRERAVRMVAEIRGQHDSEWAAISEVARLLGVGCAETVRKWVRQAQVDAGARPGTTTEESAELKRLRRDNAELRRANAILKTASAFFAAELDRPAR